MTDNNQSRIARRKAKKTKKKPVWKKILLIIGLIVIACILGVGGLFTYYISTAPKIDATKLQDAFSSNIYDMDAKIIADPGEKQRTKITYDDLPQLLIDAVTATEDSRFFKHPGIDIWRIGGAVIGNVTNGFGSQGASTITQQLVEKSFLSPEKKIKLKVQEMWLALKLERKYSKEEILEMYLNKIYYGHGTYGVAKAAEIYFGKTDLHDLTLPEAAILAGLPQRPTAYDPTKNPDLTKGRMNTVLDLMVKHDKITKKEADKARKVDISSLLAETEEHPTQYEAFLKQVQQEVKEKLDGADIYTDGLKVYTTLDTDIQNYVEFLLSDDENNPISYPDKINDSKGNKVDMKAGMTVLDTSNGAIRAIGGARGGMQKGGYSYATDAHRQAGSTMKPILAYGPAIENEKWSTYHQINDDKPFEIAGSDKKVRNWNNAYQGWMTMRYALKKSLNVPALKTVSDIGIGESQKFGENLGIKFADDQMSITDAIGGGSTLVSPLELAGAYRAFANEGIYNKPYAVTKVVFPDGRSVDLKPKPKPVMSDYTAYMVSDMLKSVISSGTGANANVSGLPVAGKTGTTNRPNVQGSPDSWFSGYTTNYTISIWTGYDDNNVGIPKSKTQIPLYLFKNTMAHISVGKKTADFTKPNSVVESAVEKGSKPASKPSKYTPDSKIVHELFVKGTEPSEKSAKYDKPDPVKNLKAAYDKDKNNINVTWDYDKDADVSFDVGFSVNGGDMQELSSTKDHKLDISNVEPGAKYTIQVTAFSNEDEDVRSDPKTVNAKGPDKDEDDDDKEIGPVSGLTADMSETSIDVGWSYDGPPAKYHVVVSADGQEVQQKMINDPNKKGIIIDNAKPGKTYVITVTTVGTKDSLAGVTGESKSVQITVPGDDTGPQNNNNNNQGDDNQSVPSNEPEQQQSDNSR